MRPQEGDTFRLAGGYDGAIFHKGKWRQYRCIVCLRRTGLVKRIVQPTDRAHEIALHGQSEFRHTARHA